MNERRSLEISCNSGGGSGSSSSNCSAGQTGEAPHQGFQVWAQLRKKRQNRKGKKEKQHFDSLSMTTLALSAAESRRTL